MQSRINKTRERLALYRARTNTPYRKVADAAGISKFAMEKLTGKTAFMTDENLDKLEAYLNKNENK